MLAGGCRLAAWRPPQMGGDAASARPAEAFQDRERGRTPPPGGWQIRERRPARPPSRPRRPEAPGVGAARPRPQGRSRRRGVRGAWPRAGRPRRHPLPPVACTRPPRPDAGAPAPPPSSAPRPEHPPRRSQEGSPPVRLHGVGQPILRQRHVECGRVAPEQGRFHPHLPITPSRHGLFSQGAAQVVEGLAQGVAGLLLVGLGPEQRQQPLPAVEATRAGARQVRQQRQTLGLEEHGNAHPHRRGATPRRPGSRAESWKKPLRRGVTWKITQRRTVA